MNNKLSYEQSIARLDDIVRSMERGDVSLEQALKLFEEGAGLIASCNKMLDDAEQMVVKLKKGPDGYPIELPFEGVE
ncbi:MAG: exodeoxyribonuclease VII small subunit [Oscillospiraceae bacterium]|nr:exodeoxyribonuclease VII small subunit [Oscillospiraceae bacterium]